MESKARGIGDSACGRASSITAGSRGGETELNCQKRDVLSHTRLFRERAAADEGAAVMPPVPPLGLPHGDGEAK